MQIDHLALAAAAFALVAVLYASVGHGGASGYLAVMALVGFSAAAMKPTALVLNLIVAAVGSFTFAAARQIHWRLLWPFAITSIPCALLGGAWSLPAHWYKAVVGLVLLGAAGRLLLSLPGDRAARAERPPLLAALAWGAAIGLLSGLVGVGGGIFLSPLLVLAGWASPRHTAGVSAPFIFVNSLAGLAGYVHQRGSALPVSALELLVFAAAVLAGGLAGAQLGSRRLNTTWLRRLMAAVVLIAGVKMLLQR